MIISERIFYVMEQKNITQLELSKRTGIATSNISDWKKKKTNPKDVYKRQIQKLSNGLIIGANGERLAMGNEIADRIQV